MLKTTLILMGEVGAVTLIIVLPAVFIGLWLDKTFGTAPILTMTLVVASIPVSIFALYRLLKRTAEKLKPEKSAPESVSEDLQNKITGGDES